MRVRTLSTPLITVQAHTHTSELDIHKACKDRQLQDLLRIVRCNDNFITATFDKISIARHAEIGGGISLSSGAGPTSSAVFVKAVYHLPHPPKIFSLDATSLDIDHDTVPQCVNRALRGREHPARYELLRQETRGEHDDRVRYILRFDGTSRPPGVQQFHIPFRSESGHEGISAVFRPENIQACCAFGGDLCQQSTISSTCLFTSVIGAQWG